MPFASVGGNSCLGNKSSCCVLYRVDSCLGGEGLSRERARTGLAWHLTGRGLGPLAEGHRPPMPDTSAEAGLGKDWPVGGWVWGAAGMCGWVVFYLDLEVA